MIESIARRHRVDPLTIVVPVLDPRWEDLARWARLARLPCVREAILVRPCDVPDPAIAQPSGVRLLSAPLGRASQMNAGAAAARTEHLLFLHADTRIAPAGIEALAVEIDRERESVFSFSLAFRSPGRRFRVLERLARLRDRLRPSPLGDQGLALPRRAFFDAGGFPDEPLFEDLLLLRRLRRALPLRVLPATASTDTERFDRLGTWRNLARNAALIALQSAGVPPRTLVRYYYGGEYLARWLAADPAREKRVRRSLVETRSE